MSKQVINLGASANDGTGDPARSAFTKANANFSEIYQYLGDGLTLNKLGTAAFKNVGTATGNVMEVGAFGVGAQYSTTLKESDPAMPSCIIAETSAPVGAITTGGIGLKVKNASTYGVMNVRWNGVQFVFVDGGYVKSYELLHNQNTTTDSNGFIKGASPVAKLFANKIEPNGEALEQEPTFEKVDVGHYLLKNTEGFSDDGWYIEMPKDANGNVLVAVQYQQLEDNTIEVKTFAKKFDEETGDILPNLDKPRDIPVGRWIDIRLKALPQPEIEISNTPIEFQPTNLAQAVAEALKNDIEQ